METITLYVTDGTEIVLESDYALVVLEGLFNPARGFDHEGRNYTKNDITNIKYEDRSDWVKVTSKITGKQFSIPRDDMNVLSNFYIIIASQSGDASRITIDGPGFISRVVGAIPPATRKQYHSEDEMAAAQFVFTYIDSLTEMGSLSFMGVVNGESVPVKANGRLFLQNDRMISGLRHVGINTENPKELQEAIDELYDQIEDKSRYSENKYLAAVQKFDEDMN